MPCVALCSATHVFLWREHVSFARCGVVLRGTDAYAKKKTNRGVGAKLIIVDETGFVDPKLFVKVITPLLLIDEAAMITLTTHSDKSEAAYNRLLGEYDEQAQTVYQKYRYSSVCPDCALRGLKNECPHQSMRRPVWQSERKSDMVKWMMRDNPDDLDREIRGLAAGGTGSVFDPNAVKRLFVRPRHVCKADPPHVYITIDPNNGPSDVGATERSDFAVVSGFRNPYGHWVVAGLESIPASRPHQYLPHLMRHIQRLREFEFLRNSKFIFVIENNTADSQWIADYLTDHAGGNQYIMRDKQLKLGCGTSYDVKQKMAAYTREVLEGDAIHLAQDLVSTSEEKLILDAFRKQLMTFAERHKIPNDPTGRVIVTFSGKDGAGGKDDLTMALLLMLYWGSKFMTDSQFAPYR